MHFLLEKGGHPRDYRGVTLRPMNGAGGGHHICFSSLEHQLRFGQWFAALPVFQNPRIAGCSERALAKVGTDEQVVLIDPFNLCFGFR